MMPKEFKEAYDRIHFLEGTTSKSLISFNLILAIIYFLGMILWFPKGDPVLYWLLIIGEIFHLWQLITYLYTVWDTSYKAHFSDSYQEPVDVFVTVAGEPTDIVEETVKAILSMNYPIFEVYILNDGYVANKDNWKDIEILAKKLGIKCITRKKPGGAKAGNINNALKLTNNPLVAIFDADHVPHKDFLEKTVGYFDDDHMGFVQSPQYYKNYDLNEVTKGAWEQQTLFFGSICRGKNRLNSVTMCGTNMLIRREALSQVGGIVESSIAEDFITGMLIHQKGWKSTYVPEVLAEGLAPEDFLSYYKQQFRWARGSLDLIFNYNFFFGKGLTIQQKIQYLASASYFFSGLIVLMNALIPIVFFYTGLVPLQTSTMTLASLFLPYIFVTIYTLQVSANFMYSFRSLAFSMAGFNIHIGALLAKIFGKKTPFSVTAKRKIDGNFLRLVVPQIIYIFLVAFGIVFAVLRDNLIPSVLANFAWATLNTAIFSEFIYAALPQKNRAVVPVEQEKVVLQENVISIDTEEIFTVKHQ